VAIGKTDEPRDGGAAASRETNADTADEIGARRVRSDSDALIGAVRELRGLEAEKRQQEISSPEFHATAHAISELARDVFRRAAEEEKHGAETGDPQGRTTEDVAPSGPVEGRG
jgi:hypothetical protein